jgi:hypothetical protein
MFMAYAYENTGMIATATVKQVFPPSAAGGTVRLSTMQQLISYLNICIAKVHAAAIPAIAVLEPPQFVWNAASRMIELWIQTIWASTPGAPFVLFTKSLNDVLVFPHYQMFGPAYDYPYAPGTITDDRWVALRTKPAQATQTYSVLSQEMNRQSAISDLARILLLSTGIGVSGNQEGSNSSTPCLTDFVPDTSSIVLGDPLIYTPAFYRWYTVDTPPAQLDRINLRVQYQTTFGETHDIIVNPGDHFSILLVFEETV